MDGDRLAYVSGGKVIVLDYDDTNVQVLNEADSAYGLFFDTNYDYLYAFDQTTSISNGTTTAGYPLDNTALLTPKNEP